jgi:hypothetical protein
MASTTSGTTVTTGRKTYKAFMSLGEREGMLTSASGMAGGNAF